MDLARHLADALLDRGLTLATAESCTGGMLSCVLTEIPGASGFFQGGIIAYHNSLKKDHLGVSDRTLREHGAVSRSTALAMAKGCRERFGTDLAVSVTGIAGPGGGSVEKPVGLVFLAVDGMGASVSDEERFSGDRARIRAQAVARALSMVLDVVTVRQ
jgi:PncC family amidohydrolase